MKNLLEKHNYREDEELEFDLGGEVYIHRLDKFERKNPYIIECSEQSNFACLKSDSHPS
jgi:hypothetical protein